MDIEIPQEWDICPLKWQQNIPFEFNVRQFKMGTGKSPPPTPPGRGSARLDFHGDRTVSLS